MMDSFIRWWGRWDLNPHGINSQRILSPLRLPISPRPQRLEVPTGFEPVITELQSIALPLGYGTIFRDMKWWGQWDLNPHGISPNGF